MKELSLTAFKSIDNYFTILANFGYKDDNFVNKLIILLFIEDIINKNYDIPVSEEEFRIIMNVLYCIYGSDCGINYPEYLNEDDVHKKPVTISRITEDYIIRFVEDSDSIRVEA